jgi:hypothetical protein
MLPAGLASALRKAPLCDEKVALAWRIAVGPAVDQASSVKLVEGVLQVEVARAEWQREIRRSSGLIRSRLGAFLGEEVVRSLKVTVDGVDLGPGERLPRPRRGHATSRRRPVAKA